MGHLNHLKSILDHKILTWIFTFLGIAFFYDIEIYQRIFQLLTLVILLFTPYLLYVLYLYDKRNWIVGFLIWGGISFLPWLVLDRSDTLISFLTSVIPLFSFLLYCWFLNQYITDWMINPHRMGDV
jgi:hypothetical protein